MSQRTKPSRAAAKSHSKAMLFLQWFRAELKALTRGRFALLTGAAVLTALLLVALLSVTSEAAFMAFVALSYVVLPLAFAPLAAAWMKAPRSTGFTTAVFTTPTTTAIHFASRAGAVLVLAATYLVATLPLFFVFVYHVGWEPIHGKFLALGAMLTVSSLAFGILLGRASPARGMAGAVAGAVVFALVGLIAFNMVESVAEMTGAKPLRLALHLVPSVLAKEALGINLGSPKANSDPFRSGVAFALQANAFLAASLWFSLRAQGPETWRHGVPLRIAAFAIVGLLAAAPVMVASTAYDRTADVLNTGREVFAGGNEYAVWLVRADEPTPNVSKGPKELPPSFALGEATQVHFVYYLRIAPHDEVPAFHVTAEAGPDVRIEIPANAAQAAVQGSGSYPFTGQATDYEGDRITHGTVLRVPAVITPTETSDLGPVARELNVTITFSGAEDQVPSETTVMTIFVHVPDAPVHLAAAGLPFPMALAVWQGIRWLRRR